MMALIWCTALLLLGLWSAFVWGSWTLWQLAVDLPWDQARVAMQDWKLPPLLEPWWGEWWTQARELLVPVLAWTWEALQTSGSWVRTAVPIVLWGVWTLGAMGVALVALAATVGVRVWRRQQVAHRR